MEENRFEKQVQQKMDELTVQPSDAVWGKIESRIPNSKKDRRLLILLLFIFIATYAVLLWESAQVDISGPGKLSKEALKNELKNKKDNVAINIIIQKNENKYTESGRDKSEISTKKIAKLTNKKTLKNAIIINKNIEQEKIYNKKKIKKNIHANIVASVKILIKSSDSFQLSDSVENTTQQDLSREYYTKTELNKNLKNDSLKIKDTAKQVTSLIPKKNKKWRTGFFITPGISFINNPIANYNAFYRIPGSINNPGSYNNVYNVRTKISPHFGLESGIFIESYFTKKISFDAGINYKYLSLSILQSNVSLQSYSKKEVNNFSFIELPLSIKIQLTKSTALPLFFQTGVIISEIVSSQSQSNLNINKTNVGANAALSFAVVSKHHSLLIGPYYYYDATKMAANGLFANRHLEFAGMRAEFILGK